MTDYGDLAKSLVNTYLPKFGTFGIECSYRSIANSSYVPIDGDSTSNIIVTQTVYMIFVTEKSSMVEGEIIKSTDKCALIASASLDMYPKINDEIVEPGGDVWVVVGVSRDPKPALYKLTVRPRYEY